jgi:hypothetical protein
VLRSKLLLRRAALKLQAMKASVHCSVDMSADADASTLGTQSNYFTALPNEPLTLLADVWASSLSALDVP